jgi:hypothetical protein
VVKYESWDHTDKNIRVIFKSNSQFQKCKKDMDKETLNQLEKEKIKLEISELNKPFYFRAGYLSIFLSAVIAAITII